MINLIVGSQWGDEGKGKLVDLLGKNADFIVGIIASGKNKLGTTKRGIGPTYADKVSYNGIGWLDLEAVKYTTQLAGVNKIVITKIDILSGLKELKVCVGYIYNGKKILMSSCGYLEMAKLTPVYKTFPGWSEDITGIRKFERLPKNCQKYIKFIEDFLKIKVKIVSVGPEREANIFVPREGVEPS